MIPDYKNLFAGIFYPGAGPRQVTEILRDFRTLMKITIEDYENYSGIKMATLLNIEKGNTANPNFNTIAKMAEGLGLCIVVDTSANMTRRQKGIIKTDDSPFAIYGDNDHPVEGLSRLLNVLREEANLNLVQVSTVTRIDLKLLMKMFNSQNVWIENTLDLLAHFDFSVSLESRNYHKIWDQVGKSNRVTPNKHNLSQREIRPVGRSISSNLHNPTIKNVDGSHLFFSPSTEKQKTKPTF